MRGNALVQHYINLKAWHHKQTLLLYWLNISINNSAGDCWCFSFFLFFFSFFYSVVAGETQYVLLG